MVLFSGVALFNLNVRVRQSDFPRLGRRRTTAWTFTQLAFRCSLSCFSLSRKAVTGACDAAGRRVPGRSRVPHPCGDRRDPPSCEPLRAFPRVLQLERFEVQAVAPCAASSCRESAPARSCRSPGRHEIAATTGLPQGDPRELQVEHYWQRNSSGSSPPRSSPVPSRPRRDERPAHRR